MSDLVNALFFSRKFFLADRTVDYALIASLCETTRIYYVFSYCFCRSVSDLVNSLFFSRKFFITNRTVDYAFIASFFGAGSICYVFSYCFCGSVTEFFDNLFSFCLVVVTGSTILTTNYTVFGTGCIDVIDVAVFVVRKNINVFSFNFATFTITYSLALCCTSSGSCYCPFAISMFSDLVNGLDLDFTALATTGFLTLCQVGRGFGFYPFAKGMFVGRRLIRIRFGLDCGIGARLIAGIGCHVLD